jgi:AmmeMemoRadiSam system protein A
MAYAFILDEHERRELLRIARATLKENIISGRIPPGAPHRESLIARAGVFVSLHAGEELRGCIGTTMESAPIYRQVQEMAIAAATRDPRFPAVKKLDEVAKLGIEISVLGERGQVKAPADVEVGKHGLIVVQGDRKGLLLPQVAADHQWDATTFLAKTCEKAGLPPDAWQKADTHVERFTAQVFSEKDLKAGPYAVA